MSAARTPQIGYMGSVSPTPQPVPTEGGEGPEKTPPWAARVWASPPGGEVGGERRTSFEHNVGFSNPLA